MLLIFLSADIQRLQRQQTVILSIAIVLLVLFIFVHGTHLFRWLKKKDYLSLRGLKHIKSNKKKSAHPTEITVANPHTQSPKINMRKLNGDAAGARSVFSISGKCWLPKSISQSFITSISDG